MTWLTRQEAAEYLKISTRQLDRLRLPRSVLGASPRYSQAALDDWLQRHMVEPAPTKRGGPKPPLVRSPLRRGPIDVKAELAKARRRLGY
jgi:hypothetical protein